MDLRLPQSDLLQLLKEIAEASAIHHQKQSELNTLLKGRDAAAAATERMEASIELLAIAEHWLLRTAHQAREWLDVTSRGASLFTAPSFVRSDLDNQWADRVR